jgi:hypothetical protein
MKKKDKPILLNVDGKVESVSFAEACNSINVKSMFNSYIYLEYHTHYGPRESWSVEIEEAYWLKTEGYKKIPDTKLARRLYKNMMGGNPPEGYLYVKT